MVSETENHRIRIFHTSSEGFGNYSCTHTLQFFHRINMHNMLYGVLSGLDPSGYRSSASHRDDESDALLGGQALMTDEERFKVALHSSHGTP